MLWRVMYHHDSWYLFLLPQDQKHSWKVERTNFCVVVEFETWVESSLNWKLKKKNSITMKITKIIVRNSAAFCFNALVKPKSVQFPSCALFSPSYKSLSRTKQFTYTPSLPRSYTWCPKMFAINFRKQIRNLIR